MRGEIWAGDGDCWLPIANRIQSKLFRLAVQAFVIQPPPIFPFPATSLPGPLPSCCFLITLRCRTCYSLCLECPTMSFPPSSSSFRVQLILLIFPRPPASCLAFHGLTHREHPTLYTSVQIPASHTGLTAPVHQDGVWWISRPIRFPDIEQFSSKY